MIERDMAKQARDLARWFPVVSMLKERGRAIDPARRQHWKNSGIPEPVMLSKGPTNEKVSERYGAQRPALQAQSRQTKRLVLDITSVGTKEIPFQHGLLAADRSWPLSLVQALPAVTRCLKT